MGTVIGISRKYQYNGTVDPNQTLLCGRTGKRKKYAELTDEDIIEMMTDQKDKAGKVIKKGHAGFSEVKPAAPAVAAVKAS